MRDANTGHTRPARPKKRSTAGLLDLASRALSPGTTPHCLILYGPIGSGKTTTARRLAETLSAQGVAIGGILAPRLLEDGSTVGYAVEDLRTGERRPLASLEGHGVSIGRYVLSETGLEFSRKAIARAQSAADVIFIDEVGRLEIEGAGHARSVQAALGGDAMCVMLVRSGLVDRVLERFEIPAALVLDVGSCAPQSPSGAAER